MRQRRRGRATADGTTAEAVGRVDLDAVASVGEEFGDFSVEALAALEPDLVLTVTYSRDSSVREGRFTADQLRESQSLVFTNPLRLPAAIETVERIAAT